jgi:pimeloyl-ACP methyl ester carboxylesterase
METALETFRAIGSRGYVRDDARIRDVAARSFDRGHDPGGYLRQLDAILAQPDRTKKLGGLELPALVIHGRSDPLVNSSGGRALAKAIPGARLHLFPGMGHDMPRELWPKFVDEISDVADRGDARLGPTPAGL